ncbi:MAG: ABC transporter permease [Candidatus Zixiibacteriota bacterium]
MYKIKQMAIKEIRHIIRDPRSLIIAIIMPIMMTFLYGYAINLDIKNITLSILDFDKSVESRELAAKFYNSGYFIQPKVQADIIDPENILKTGHASAVLTIRDGFAKALKNMDDYELGLLVDGSDANTAAAISTYCNIITIQYAKNHLLANQFPPGFEIPGIVISQQILYNPDLKSSHFFVPGLIGVILMMISALLTSMTIAREKETGTMEQLLTAPVSPLVIIFGKVLPYIGLAFLDGLLVILFAVFHFGVPFVGSIVLLVFFGVVYIIAALSIGILISTLVQTQQVAMMAALMMTLLPSVMLSGFIFEIRNMPKVLQYFTYIIPARHFVRAIRGVLLKSSDWTVLWGEALFLIILSLILLTISSKLFKLKLQ